MIDLFHIQQFPLTLIISPSIADSSDDFPDPTVPTTATRSPSPTSRLTDFRVGAGSAELSQLKEQRSRRTG